MNKNISLLQISIFMVFFLLLYPMFSQEMVSVLDFKAEGGISEYEAGILRSVLETELISSGRYRVIEKAEQEQVISAQRDTLQGCVDDACAVEIGRLLAADKILTGAVAKFGSRYILTVKIIDIETGRSIRADNIRSEYLEGLLDNLSDLVINIAGGNLIEEKEENMPEEIPDNFVFVEGGTFRMGSTNGDDAESPVHSVTVGGFLIGKYEVTQKLYREVVGFNPSDQRRGIGDNYPVNKVTWYDAVIFCNKLSETEELEPVYILIGNNVLADWTKNGYRLPTEAEWEYAARGGVENQGYIYSGSNNPGEVAWYTENSESMVHPVGMKSSNEIGLYDMTGNVREWCWDRYGSYTSVPVENPAGPPTGTSLVIRGGGWGNSDFNSRVTSRGSGKPRTKYFSVGFRLVRSIFPGSS